MLNQYRFRNIGGVTMHSETNEADPFEEPSLDGLRPVLTVSLGREVFAT